MRKIILLLLLIPSFATSLTDFSASYNIYSKGIKIGTATRDFTHSHGHYTFTVKTQSPIPLLRSRSEEKSEGRWQNGPIPHHYDFDQRSRLLNKHLSQVFNWNDNTINSDYKNKHRHFNITHGMQDALSVQLQLQQDLHTGKKQFSYTVANRKQSEAYLFKIIKEEAVSTPMGTYHTIALKRIKDDPKRDTVFWVAPDLNYALLKIKHREKKYTITALLTAYHPKPK